MNARDNKAVIGFEADQIFYTEAGKELWRVPLVLISIVGEYTTKNGPYIDDYFLVFVTRSEGKHFHASFYAEGRNEALVKLPRGLGEPLRCCLANSTKLISRCIWPPELLGKSLFRFSPLPSTGGGWKRLQRALSPQYTFDFSDEVRSYLASSKSAIQSGAPPA